GAQVEPEAPRDLDRHGQRGLAAKIESAERSDLHRQTARVRIQQGRRERAPKAVPSADESDVQRTWPSSKPTRSSIRSCRARTSGPISRGAKRIIRAFQTSRGSVGQS